MLDLPGLPPLRDYQERGYQDLRRAAGDLLSRRGEGSGFGVLAVAPTGAGKTRVGLEFVRSGIARDGQTLWLAPRNELVAQPIARLHELGWHAVKSISGGRVEGDPTAPITVASIQTLVARGFAPPATHVVFDEARHYVAAEWGKIAASYAGAVRLGLDASPMRADGSPLGDLFDALVPISSVAELTSLGWLVPSIIYAPGAYQRELAGTPLEKWRQHANGLRTIVFCQTKVHAAETAAEFNAAGISAMAVDADTDKEQRRDAIAMLRSGAIKVLCNCMLYTEGLDVVELEAIIIARGVSNPSGWIQMGGRPLRPSPHTNKRRAIVIDLRGHVHLHGYGLLDDPRSWHLDGKPIRQMEALPSIRQCPKCHAWGRGGRPCASCGEELPAPKPPKVRAANLQAIRRAEPPGMKLDRLRRLIERELDAGRNPWRASHVYRGVYGEAPSADVMRNMVSAARRGRQEVRA